MISETLLQVQTSSTMPERDGYCKVGFGSLEKGANSMHKARILVVEDESIVALDIQSLLGNLGYEVTAIASSGEVAVDKAVETQPDLVLMDIKLKGAMDGVQAAEQIQARFDIPIIYLTAYADETTLERAKITEPFGYLLKPFEERELHTTLEMALYKHKMEKRLRESERWLATTLKSIGEAVIATDAQGCIEFMNPVAEELTAWKQQEALGKDLGDVFKIIDEQMRAPTQSPVTQALLEGVVVGSGNHTLLITKDGAEIPVDQNAAPIRDDQGNITGAVLIFQDISERVQAEKAIQRHNRELAVLNQIIAASAASLEPETVLETACRELALSLDIPQVAAMFLNQDKTEATLVTEFLTEGQASSLNSTLCVADNPLFQDLLTRKVPLVIDNAVSQLLVPLMIEGEVVGSLSLKSAGPRQFSTEEVNLAWSVSDQVAGALVRVQLNAERQRLGAAIEQTAEGVIITDAEGVIVYINPAFERISGYSRTEVIGRKPNLVKSGEQDPALYEELWATITAGQVWHGRLINKRKDGTLYTVDTTITPVRDERGDTVNYIGLQRDVTRELQLEERYRQAQKMEAVGQLTAGIAHDFNNMLTAINGFAEFIKIQMSPDDPLYEFLDRILRSGWRAADLVSQLLAFSRKQIIQPKVLDLNTLVAEMDKLLQRVIGEHIQMETILVPDLWPVKVDPAQVEQVVVNLAVNARDAMPQGGKLIIETANVVLDEGYVAEHLDMQPGEYVLLAVSDTGVGMSDEIKAHIFEPFFTTKKMGEGTGLGLATVHGIVKQSGGDIWVYSEEGQGTTFKIYLPRTREAAPSLARPKVETDMPCGSETILLVEDDVRVRELARYVLQTQGYTLLEAQDGQEALQLASSHFGSIQLLLTDVVMPGMNGKDLVRQLAQDQPDLRILLMSGYTDDVIAHHGGLDPNVAFLQKPFGPVALARKVRDVLDG